MRRRLSAWLVATLFCLAPAAAAHAQTATSGSIAGTVRDTSGAVLPGVTVEAASPALIEKVRTVVTDDQGAYKIIDLRPGTYTVTFSLTGFATVKREGIELNAGFTAPVSAELKVGAIEETVTVTGASPVVDVQNTRSQAVLTRDTLDTLPTGGKGMQNYAALILGATLSNAGGQDVGGSKGESPTLSSFTVHGSSSSDSRYTLEGMIAYTALETSGGPGVRHAFPNPAMMQDTVVTTGSASPEIETGGPNVNYVPRDGGNRRTWYGNTDYTGPDLQADKLTDEARARGLRAQAKVKKVYDFFAGAGGPLKQDKVWYYAAGRRSVGEEYLPGAYFNGTVGTPVYTPDLSRPAFTRSMTSDVSSRVTWQINRKSKLAANISYHNVCICYLSVNATTPPDGASAVYFRPISLNQFVWNYAASNRTLVEAGALFSFDPFPTVPPEGSGVDPFDDIPMLEKATNTIYNARQQTASLTDYTGPLGSSQNMWGQKVSVSYVTGSHAFKVGTLIQEGHRVGHTEHAVGVRFEFLNGAPSSLTMSAAPFYNQQWLRPNLGIYAQDQWTRSHFTFNLGVRFDYLHEMVPETTVPAGIFVAARTYPEVQDVPKWTDWNPRLGVAYDVFGNGRTAIKASISRFDAQEATGMAALNAPANQIVGFVTRTWNYTGPVPATLVQAGKTNGVITVPGCDITNFAANGACGPISNVRFGTAVPTITVDPTITHDTRGYSWQSSVSLQQELRSGLALNVGWFRTQYGNYYVNVNQAVSASEFDSYCVTAPTDPRLESASGQPVCGLFDVRPAKFGQVSSYITPAEPFGTPSQVYTGVDAGMNWRFGQGGLLQGGMNIGHTVLDTCFQKNLPNLAVQSQNFSATSGGLQPANTPRVDAYCHVSPPWSSGLQFKFSGIYPLPWWGLQTSATFQNLPGVAQSANFTATNAQIAPSLGRNLAACGAAAVCNATVTIPIVLPNTLLFEDRLTQVDLRITKIFRGQASRLTTNFDIYNLFNDATILGSNAAYGPAWLTPTAVFGARTFKFGVQVDF